MRTSYSRRELYAAGEPLGESVTRKEGGRVVYGGGGGGGGPPPEQKPQSQSVYQSTIPEYAKPYVETMLGTAQQQIYNYDDAGHPTTMKEYKPYSTDPNAYVAGFSPMQQNAMQSAQGMQAGPQGFQQDVGAYMSPFIQQALQPQLREAARGSAIQGQQQQAQATQAGAFGGGRDAIMRAERERNLGQLQGDIMSQGMQNAYNSAQNQYNTGFGQQTGLIGLQNQLGGQQQQLEQSKMNQMIQNYATAQQYPMMQLGNMSNLLRGLPMQSTTVQNYQAAPNPLSQLAGLGTAAYGAYKAFGAEGGQPEDFKKRPAGLAELALMKMQ
jgi:hypothetical protein